MEKDRNFVVPHDFSEAADNALMQAIEIAKPSSKFIYYMWLIKKMKLIKLNKNLMKYYLLAAIEIFH